MADRIQEAYDLVVKDLNARFTDQGYVEGKEVAHSSIRARLLFMMLAASDAELTALAEDMMNNFGLRDETKAALAALDTESQEFQDFADDLD